MAFKSMTQYNDERYKNFFLLKDDGDYADVIFLYTRPEDVLMADVHYIKSDDYSGYVHCCGKGCPACEKGIYIQNKLFIPVYNLNTKQVEFFDRSVRFWNVLERSVFANFSNPSEYVFRITRHGKSGEQSTYYDISLLGAVNGTSYEEILKSNNVTFPDYYNNICKEVTTSELSDMLNNRTSRPDSGNMPSYTVTPRAFPGNDADAETEVAEEPSYVAAAPEATPQVPAEYETLDEEDVQF